MLPVIPGMKIGAHVEVFGPDGELVHTSRPGLVCGRCGVDFERVGLVVPAASGTPLCPPCSRRP